MNFYYLTTSKIEEFLFSAGNSSKGFCARNASASRRLGLAGGDDGPAPKPPNIGKAEEVREKVLTVRPENNIEVYEMENNKNKKNSKMIILVIIILNINNFMN